MVQNKLLQEMRPAEFYAAAKKPLAMRNEHSCASENENKGAKMAGTAYVRQRDTNLAITSWQRDAKSPTKSLASAASTKQAILVSMSLDR